MHILLSVIKERGYMLRIIVGVLLALWLIGLIAHVAGGLIYVLLVIAVIVFVYDTFIGRKA
jgi:4-hydroxybenzoate polyprenyltransferase